MYIGLGVTIVKGTIDVGGFGRIWQVAMDSGRVANLGYVSLDPAQVHGCLENVHIFSTFCPQWK